jgi:hypothetical protein
MSISTEIIVSPWLLFLCAFLALTVMMYVSGYFLSRVFGIGGSYAVALAPAFSAGGVASIAICNGVFGISSSWATTVVPLTVVGALLFAMLWKTGHLPERIAPCSCSPWLGLGLFVGVGIVIGAYAFLRPMGDPNSFSQEYDNIYHLNMVQAFFQSGDWSSLSPSKYAATNAFSVSPISQEYGFYPSAWHCVACLPMGLFGISAAMAENVANFFFASVVFPSGMFVVVDKLAKGDKAVVYTGAVCAMAFAAFPYNTLYFGPLFPNTASNAMVPAVSILFMYLVESLRKRGGWILPAIAFLIGFVTLALLQTNAIFFAIVLLAPYAASVIASAPVREHAKLSTRARAVLFSLLVIVLWLVAYKLPAFSRVVSFNWVSSNGWDQALEQVLLVGYGALPASVVVAVLVLFGIWDLHTRKDEARWLIVSYCLFAFMYVVMTSTEGTLKHVLTGFWYTDSFRIAACLAITSVPIAAFGAARVVRWGQARFGALPARESVQRSSARSFVMPVGALLAVVLMFVPSITFGGFVQGTAATPFGKLRAGISSTWNNVSESILTPEEEDFVAKAKQVVGDDLVINLPDDGSVFAYGEDDLNTYYRYVNMEDSSASAETGDSVAIRTGLSAYASNPDTLAAVEDVQARYVLLLDEGDAFVEQKHFIAYDGSRWTGISSITDSTPGFELVLSEGDMRLYRLTY